MKILISDAFDPPLPEKLTAFGEVTEDKDQLAEMDVVLVEDQVRDYIDQATNLRLIIRGGVGLDNIDVEYARSKGVQVFNTAEASAVGAAELAFALMISVPTRLVEGHLGMTRKEWLKGFKRTKSWVRPLGLFGAGNIGTELARRRIAFGMRVIAYDPFLKSHEAVDLVSMEELLTESDYMSLHVPLTDETRGMIDTETIGRMKDGVVIVNTSRALCQRSRYEGRANTARCAPTPRMSSCRTRRRTTVLSTTHPKHHHRPAPGSIIKETCSVSAMSSYGSSKISYQRHFELDGDSHESNLELLRRARETRSRHRARRSRSRLGTDMVHGDLTPIQGIRCRSTTAP